MELVPMAATVCQPSVLHYIRRGCQSPIIKDASSVMLTKTYGFLPHMTVIVISGLSKYYDGTEFKTWGTG